MSRKNPALAAHEAMLNAGTRVPVVASNRPAKPLDLVTPTGRVGLTLDDARALIRDLQAAVAAHEVQS